ncbi:hypothetical protein ACXYRK_01780 [Mycoplasma sp. AC1221]
MKKKMKFFSSILLASSFSIAVACSNQTTTENAKVVDISYSNLSSDSVKINIKFNHLSKNLDLTKFKLTLNDITNVSFKNNVTLNTISVQLNHLKSNFSYQITDISINNISYINGINKSQLSFKTLNTNNNDQTPSDKNPSDGKPKESKTDANIVNISHLNITKNSVDIAVKLSNVPNIEVDKFDVSINPSDGASFSKQIDSSDPNSVIVHISGLNQNTQYTISDIKYDNVSIKSTYNNSNDFTFKTLEPEQHNSNQNPQKENEPTISINNISTQNITSTSATLKIKLNNISDFNINKLSISLNPSDNFTISKQLDTNNLDTAIVSLSGLSSDTNYKITEIQYDNTSLKVADGSLNLSFKTLVDSSKTNNSGQNNQDNENKPVNKPSEPDNSQSSQNPGYTLSAGQEEAEASKDTTPQIQAQISDYGNAYDLQNADAIQSSELNIHNSTNFSELEQSSLNSKDNWSTYFNYLASPTAKSTSNDVELTLHIDSTKTTDISSISENNSTITITFNDASITTAKVLVKSFDQHNKWSKYIDLTKNSGNWTFQSNLLSNYQNQYVITEATFNNSYKVPFSLQKKYKFSLPEGAFNSLDLTSLTVYKNESSKEIFGSAAFNWTSDQVKILSDKVFVFTFDVEKQVYTEKKSTDSSSTLDIFGGGQSEILNADENFDAGNSIPATKKIYIPFNQLHKFSLSGFQEQIKYKLKYLDVVNSGSNVNFLKRKDLASKNIAFSYIFNWNQSIDLKNQLSGGSDTSTGTLKNAETISKSDLVAESKKANKNTKISFTPQNFNTLLDYNNNFYNFIHRYPNTKESKSETKFVLYKNNQQQNIHWFKTRNYLENSLFKINEDKTSASFTQDLSEINTNGVPDEDVIIWLVFELDMNTAAYRDINEVSDIRSKVIVPVSLKNIKEHKHVSNVDFMFDYVSGKKSLQQVLFAKIKNNVTFALHFENNILKLVLKTKNGTKFNNILSMHNHSNSRSAFINRFDVFVNWIQSITDSTPKITFKQKHQIDKNSILTSSEGYIDKYDVKVLADSTDHGEPTTNFLQDSPKGNERSKRLYQEDNVAPIQEARSRVFSINHQADGTWNIIGKVSDKKDDYRFYAFVNYHVWHTNTSDINKDLYKVSTDASGAKIITVHDAKLIAPTLMNRPVNPNSVDRYQPVYTQINSTNNEDFYHDTKLTGDINPTGNIYSFKIPENEAGITYKIFLDLSANVANDYDEFKNTDGEVVDRKDPNASDHNKNNNANVDTIIAIVDFAPIFKHFNYQNLDTYTHDNKKLTTQEKAAIKHFLDFQNLKPIDFSTLSLYVSSFDNLNFYMATLPKNRANGNADSAPGLRYREYLIGNNPIKTSYFVSNYNTQRPAIWGQVKDYDWFNGSSGSGVYDSKGKIVGLDAKGSRWTSSNFSIFDTQEYQYWGASGDDMNPQSFKEVVSKMAYLYPQSFTNLYQDKK